MMFDPKLFHASASAWQRAALDYSQMCFFASQVIWRRSAEMAMGTMSRREATRMVYEKPVAFAKAAQQAAMAEAAGKGYAGATAAAIRPIRAKTRANAKRLAARKP